MITAEDVAQGVWVARQDADWSQQYVAALTRQGQKQLMILHPEVDFVGPTRVEQQRLAGLGVKLVKSID